MSKESFVPLWFPLKKLKKKPDNVEGSKLSKLLQKRWKERGNQLQNVVRMQIIIIPIVLI